MRRGAPLQSYRSSSMTLETDDDLEGGGLGNQTSPLVASQLEMSGDVSGKAKGPPRSAMARKFLSQHASPNSLARSALVLLTATLLVAPFLAIQWCILLLVFASCAFGGIASIWLSRVVLQCDDGTAEMRAVSDPIREGASGFLRVQYSVSTMKLRLVK
jgi:hypothetical protein